MHVGMTFGDTAIHESFMLLLSNLSKLNFFIKLDFSGMSALYLLLNNEIDV